MKNYVFKKQGIVVKAKSERQAREIYNQYLHDSSDLGVAEFLKSKGIKFSKIDGTKGNIIIKFDNEKDWTLGSKHLRTKYGRKGYESIKEGNSYKVILGDIDHYLDSLTEDEQLKYQTTFRGEESQEIRLSEGSCYCNYDKTRNVTHVTFMGGQRNQTSRDFTIRGKITTVEQLKKEIDKHLK